MKLLRLLEQEKFRYAIRVKANAVLGRSAPRSGRIEDRASGAGMSRLNRRARLPGEWLAVAELPETACQLEEEL